MLALQPNAAHSSPSPRNSPSSNPFALPELTISHMRSFLSSARYHTEPVPSNCVVLPSQSTSTSPPAIPSLFGNERVFWVGCSDSSISETDAIDVPRDEIFVHRNLGNQLSHSDLSSLSALELCVEQMQVQHIIICGHYGCGLMDADGETICLHNWFLHMRELRDFCSHCYPKENGIHRHCHLVELNVLAQMTWLMQQPNVLKAIEERGMEVHGFIYNPENGECVRLVVDGNATELEA